VGCTGASSKEPVKFVRAIEGMMADTDKACDSKLWDCVRMMAERGVLRFDGEQLRELLCRPLVSPPSLDCRVMLYNLRQQDGKIH